MRVACVLSPLVVAGLSLFGAVAEDGDDVVMINFGGGNACPSSNGGWNKINSVAACRSAMRLLGYLGIEYNGDEDDASWPAGCYFCHGVPGCTDGFWFNAHPTGATNGDAAPVCERGLTPLDAETAVLFMGDSDVDFWPATAAEFVPSHNVAVAGYTCGDVLDEADDMLAAFAGERLEWVVLVCGENDIAAWAGVETAYARFASIVSKATAADARVLYLGTKPEPATWDWFGWMHDQYRAYDGKVRALATSLATAAADDAGTAGPATAPPPLVMVDVYPSFEALGNPGSFYADDRLHLSALGYEKWTHWTQLALDPDAPGGCVRWLSGACVEFQVAPSGFATIASGTCDVPIGRASECEGAAGALGLEFKKAVDTARWPRGCVLKGTKKVYFNGAESNKNCNDKRQCICPTESGDV